MKATSYETLPTAYVPLVISRWRPLEFLMWNAQASSYINTHFMAIIHITVLNSVNTGKVKISLFQAVKAHRVARG
jgi:hypothetical protein